MWRLYEWRTQSLELLALLGSGGNYLPPGLGPLPHNSPDYYGWVYMGGPVPL